MSARLLTVALASVLLTCVTVRALSQDAAGEPERAVPAADLEVTLEYVGGKTATFSKEIVRLELILNPAGRLDQLHLVTRTGPDADTHIWYNVDNLVSVKYRFIEITGKGKVSVRTFTAPALREGTTGPPKEIVPLDSEDYR